MVSIGGKGAWWIVALPVAINVLSTTLNDNFPEVYIRCFTLGDTAASLAYIY